MKKLKKLSVIIEAGLMIFLLACCSNNSNVSTSSYNPESLGKSELLADISYDNEDGLPPVNDELKSLYNKAFSFKSDVYFDNFKRVSDENGECILKEDGETIWYEITDDRFSDVSEMKSYMYDIFTQESVQDDLKIIENGFKDVDNKLYTIGGARGGDITYAGHYFTIDSVNDDSVVLTAHIYHADDAACKEPIYCKLEDESEYTVENIKLEFIKVNGVWKISQFMLPY